MLPKRIVNRIQRLKKRICCISSAADPVATTASIKTSICCINRSWGHYAYVSMAVRDMRRALCCEGVTTPPLPRVEPPVSFATNLATDIEIDVSWSDVGYEVGYVLERSLTGTSGWTVIATFPQDYLGGYADLDIEPDTTYYYRMKSLGDGINFSDSVYTAIESETTPAIVTGDPDAEAFFAAASITDPVQQDAVNTLVTSAKTNGWWALCDAIYPIVGGNGASHSVNLKNPTVFNIGFYVPDGGFVHNAYGWKPLDGYNIAFTGYEPATQMSGYDGHISLYSGTPGQNLNADMHVWSNVGGPKIAVFYAYTNATYGYWHDHASGNDIIVMGNGGLGQYMLTSRASNDLSLYMGTTLLGTNTNVLPVNNGAPGGTIAIGTTIDASIITGRNIRFATIGKGIPHAIAVTMANDIETYQIALGRSAFAITDVDAANFISAAGITDDTQKSAVEGLVTSLKAASLWTKAGFVYPFVGGTAAAHAVCLTKPNPSFNLNFQGSWTHNSVGITPSVYGAYAITPIVPDTHLPASNRHLSFYSRSDILVPGKNWAAYYGGNYLGLAVKSIAAEGAFEMDGPATYGYNGSAVGLNMVSRINDSDVRYYINTANNKTDLNTYAPESIPIPLYLNASNAGSAEEFDVNGCSFASAGQGFTVAEQTTYYNIIQTFQTALGRAL